MCRVNPRSSGREPTCGARHTCCGLAAQPVLMCWVSSWAGAAQGTRSCPRLARPAPWRRLRIQPQMGEDLLDDWPLQNGCNSLELPAAAVRAELHVDVKDAPEQPVRAYQLIYSRSAIREYPLLAGPTGNQCQLSGSLKSDDSFRAVSSETWSAQLDPLPPFEARDCPPLSCRWAAPRWTPSIPDCNPSLTDGLTIGNPSTPSPQSS
jgi:hypothetical protein